MAMWRLGSKFSHENGLKFSEKILVGIFLKMNISQKKIFTFNPGLLLQRLLEVSLGCMACAFPYPTLIKWREAY